MAAHRDNIGRRFGKLTVLEKVKTKTTIYYICKCDCGKETIALASGLTGRNSKKSCGCARKDGWQRRKRMDIYESLINQIKGSYEANAKKRNFIFTLTREEVINLIEGNCHYCGTPKCNLIKSSSGKGSMLFNGIDRVDSEKGYEYLNCVSCCKTCNRAKSDLGFEEYRDWVIKSYKHLSKNFRKSDIE